VTDSTSTKALNQIQHAEQPTTPTTARVLASQAEAIVRTGKHGHNIEQIYTK